MNEDQFKRALGQLAGDAFPNTTDAWRQVRARLADHESRKPAARPAGRRWLPLAAGLALLAALAVFGLVPHRQAIADAFRHLFQVRSAEQIPTLPAEYLLAPTFEPTYAVTLAPAVSGLPSETALPTGDQQGFSVPACEDDPYGYACKLAWAEHKGGYDAKVLPNDPAGFHYRDVFSDAKNNIFVEYDANGGGGYLYLIQGISDDFVSFTSPVPEDAIQAVQVGDYPGEYAEGDYTIGGEHESWTWLPCCRARLLWTEGNHWYQLDKEAALPTTDYMTREVMIQMALSLVDQPEPDQPLDPAYLTSYAQAAQLAKFDFLAPQVLPQGFRFDYASYDAGLEQLRLTYTLGGDAHLSRIWVYETPLDKVDLAPGANGELLTGEAVHVDGQPGVYSAYDNRSPSLSWRTEKLKISLYIASSVAYGGVFTREQVLEIGASFAPPDLNNP